MTMKPSTFYYCFLHEIKDSSKEYRLLHRTLTNRSYILRSFVILLHFKMQMVNVLANRRERSRLIQYIRPTVDALG